MSNISRPAKTWSGISHRDLTRNSAVGIMSNIAFWFLTTAAVAQTQDALVTFYAPVVRLENVLPFSSNKPFFGNVFDGPDLLFSFHSHELMQHDRFITLRLPSGSHLFSLSMENRADNKKVPALNLEAGKHYFLRVLSKSHGGQRVVGTFHDTLTVVACKDAIAEAHDFHPLKPNKPPAALSQSLVAETSFPVSCDYFSRSGEPNTTQPATHP